MGIVSSARVLFIFLAICTVGYAEGKSPRLSEQTEFSAEDEAVKQPVPIPGDVLVLLRHDELVRHVLENESIPAEKLPLAWFSASRVHLANLRESDLVVMGEGQLRGANVITFWVFRSTASGYTLILTAPAHDLIVKKVRWKGFREIELLAATAVKIHTALFRFDGKRYQIYREKWEPIR